MIGKEKRMGYPSFDSKAQAVASAKKVKYRMDDPSQWRVEVHENLGWHWRLVRGRMSLHQSRPLIGALRYWTLLSTDGKGGGEVYWTPNHKTFLDPNEAVRFQLALARKHIRKCQKAIGEFTYVH